MYIYLIVNIEKDFIIILIYMDNMDYLESVRTLYEVQHLPTGSMQKVRKFTK